MHFLRNNPYYLLLALFLVSLTALSMEPANPVKNLQPLSLISNDGRRFWIAPEKVFHFPGLQAHYKPLGFNKFYKTDLDESTLHILKDMIDAEYDKRNLKQTLQEHQKRNDSQAQLADLIRASTALELPHIAHTAAEYLFTKKSEFSTTEFETVGKINLAYCKFIAIQVSGRVMMLPEAIAKTCPYFEAMISSQCKESKDGIVKVSYEYEIDAVRLIKNLIELIYAQTIAQKKTDEEVAQKIREYLQNQETISTQAIIVADHWLMLKLAHTITQYILEQPDITVSDIARALPDFFRVYVPPFKHNDMRWLNGKELAYLQYTGLAHHVGLIENIENVSKNSITLLARLENNFDTHITRDDNLEIVFKQSYMQKIAALLRKELIFNKDITKDIFYNSRITKSIDSSPITSLIQVGQNRLLATTKRGTTAHILDARTGDTQCTLGGFFENVCAANQWDNNHIITASSTKSDQINTFFAAYTSLATPTVDFARLKLWNIAKQKPECIKEMKVCLPGGAPLPKIKYVAKLDDTTAIAQLGHNTLAVCDMRNQTTQIINLAQILNTTEKKKILVLDASRIAILYKHLWDPANRRWQESLGILDIRSKNFTPLPSYCNYNVKQTLATLTRFGNDHVATCAHEKMSVEEGQSYSPIIRIIDSNTGKEQVLTAPKLNNCLYGKKDRFSALKIDDTHVVSTGTSALTINRETDTIDQFIIHEIGNNPSRCATFLGNGRIAVGMHNGEIRIITAASLMSLQEIIAARKQHLISLQAS